MQATPTTATLPLAAPREKRTPADWTSALPDALAFAIGLGVARWAGWTAGDLIWSLWLSSFVVGYTTILWIIGFPSIAFARLAWKTRNDAGCSNRQMMLAWALIAFGASFMLAFFTLHFGGFHYVHSQILLQFFPIDQSGIPNFGWGDKAVYLEVLRRYWMFLPSAFLSHRAIFMRTPWTLDPDRLLSSFASAGKSGGVFAEPYRNVLRMHGLIFFFFIAHFAGLENFAVYTVIYAVYFFPWRLVRGESSTA
jgi:hypothetical protein